MTIYVLRGAPASGKSTWIKNNNFEPYTISSDNIRMLYPFNTDENNNIVISQMWDFKVWPLLLKLLEERLKFNQPVIIDATHTKISSIKEYAKLADKYKYDIVIVDFTTCSLEESLNRNNNRKSFQKVPNNVIERSYNIIKESSCEFYNKYDMIFPTVATSRISQDIKNCIATKNIDQKDFIDLIGTLKGLRKMPDSVYEKVFDEVCELFPILSIEKGYNQENKYHNLTLDYHTLKVISNLPFLLNKETLYIGALFHDIGKPYVAFKGEDGYNHYYGHPRFGAELVKSKVMTRLKNIFSEREIWFTGYLIKHHDDYIDKDFIERQLKKNLTLDEIEQLLYLEIADAKAHIQDDKMQKRIEISQKILDEVRGKTIEKSS